ncbi:MAG: hypothetical protein V4594_09785 [Bacteroidota bacterium]
MMFASIGFAVAQNPKTIRGAVVQEGTKARIEQVEIRNYRSGQLTHSDKFGLFELSCKIGDTLQIERIGYQPHKMAVQNFSDLVIRLRPNNQLKEVKITSQLASQSYREISKAYSREKGIFYGGKPPLKLLLPLGGRPITFFYELLGKDGRRVRRLNQLAKQAAKAEEIDRYFNDHIIQQAVPIDSARLGDFKLKYTPKLEKLRKWSDYERATYIKASYEEFKTSSQ